jgi:hypothetical protein
VIFCRITLILRERNTREKERERERERDRERQRDRQTETETERASMGTWFKKFKLIIIIHLYGVKSDSFALFIYYQSSLSYPYMSSLILAL